MCCRYVIDVLQVCYLCVVGMLLMCCRYVIDVLQVCYSCLVGMLFMCCRYGIHMLQVCHLCVLCYHRYYPALKTLEQLEHTYLPRISRFRFTQHMCSTIPTIRAQIKEASMSDLKDFLESIRRHCSRVGEAAMVQVSLFRHFLQAYKCGYAVFLSQVFFKVYVSFFIFNIDFVYRNNIYYWSFRLSLWFLLSRLLLLLGIDKVLLLGSSVILVDFFTPQENVCHALLLLQHPIVKGYVQSTQLSTS